MIRRFPLRATLLATQIALSLTLLVNVGLLVRSVPSFGDHHLGYSANGISVASLEPPASYGPERLRDVARVLRVRLHAFGPEERFAIATNAPFRAAAKRFVRLPGHSPDISRAHNVVGVSENYFRLLNIPLLTGRGFSLADGGDAIVINETMARKYFGSSDAVGQTMLVGSSRENSTAKLIVGIVRDAVTDRSGLGARSSVQPGLYELVSADSRFDADPGYKLPELLVRGTPDEFQHRLDGLVSSVDSRVAVRIAPLSVGISGQTSEVGFMAALGGALGAIALTLASIGVFGLFAYIVRDQTRNIGIRIALGARPVQVLRDTLGFGIRPIVVGAVLGLAGAFSAAQILRGEVYGVSPLDPLAYLSAMGVLAATAAAAISIPAWRATRVDPIVALRHD